jgi:tetratricopeptide (TPR) repeat protein
MPAHTYQRVGLYQDAIAANLDGTERDRAYFAKAGPQAIYHFYMAHNQHFGTWSAMYLGDSKTALRMARECVRDLPPHLLEHMAPFCDGFLAVPWHVMVRFGRWPELLAEPQPAASFPIARAMWHYARGIARVNTGDLAAAGAEQTQLDAAIQAVPAGAMLGFSPAGPALEVARHMLAGELLFRSGQRTEGIASLRRAVELEDNLRYDEPSSWMTPVRHALGALLLESGDAKAAAEVYREDLARHPQNGWSLHGLAECLRQAGDPGAEAVAADFRRAFRHADVEITASCYCRRQ